MSGIFFSFRIFSPASVTGPLAASTISLALIESALASLITFSRAAGIRMSQSRAKNSSVVIFSASILSSDPVLSLAAWIFSISRPSLS